MYTENNRNYSVYNDEYYDEDENNASNDNKKGIIVKIIIIAICLIILIWLIIALKGSNSDVAYNPSVHAENIQKVRLAAERYFFIEGNMPKNNETKVVTVETLVNKGLTNEVVDANQKVCNDIKSTASLHEEDTTYVLKIKLSCSIDENEETFYYNKKNNYACLNCNGVTNMDGKINSDNKKNNDDTEFSCKEWSAWSTTRIKDSSLKERTRTLYIGVKRGGTKQAEVYSEWMKYPDNTVISLNNSDIETKEEIEKVWSEVRTSQSAVSESDTVRLISVSTEGGESYQYCPKGYKKQDNKCVSESKQRGDLTYLEYNSGDYYIYNKPCDAFNTEKNSEGKYELVYKNCLYSKIVDMKKGTTSSYTVYSYQVLEEKKVKYYRTKTMGTVQEDDVYTTQFYEESKLPEGYTKFDGSAKVEYSYMSICEK